jgi:transposase
MIGRALRPQEGKTAIILDHVGNILRLGHPMYFVEDDWSLDGKAIDKTDGADAIKVCPDCNSVIPRNSRECHECGHDFTIDPIELKIVNGELVEISPYEELRPIIEPMVEEGLSYRAIAKSLNNIGYKIGRTTVETIIKTLNLKTLNKRRILIFKDSGCNLKDKLEPMVSSGMTLREISDELFKVGITDSTGNPIGKSPILRLIKRLNLREVYKLNKSSKQIAKERDYALKDTLESMVSKGMTLREISDELFKLGITDFKGDPISSTPIRNMLKRFNLKTVNKSPQQIAKERDHAIKDTLESMVSKGMTLREISAELFKLGFTNSKGGPIGKTQIGNMIKRLQLNQPK